MSRKRTLRLGLLIFALAGFAAACSTNFTMLLIARACCAVGAALFLPSSYAYVGDEVPFDRRAQVMGRVMFGWAGSMVLGVPLGGALSELAGWRGALAALGAFGMLAFSIAVRMLVETSVAAAFVVASVTWLTCRCRSVSCDAACASSHDQEKPRRVGQAGQRHFATRMEPQSDGRLIRCRIGGFGK